LHALPILAYFSLAAEGRQLLADFPVLDQWLNKMKSRPSVQRTKSRYESAS
jgi:glutathione S-transferase